VIGDRHREIVHHFRSGHVECHRWSGDIGDCDVTNLRKAAHEIGTAKQRGQSGHEPGRSCNRDVHPEHWLQLLHNGLGRFYNLRPRKGSIEIGADADIAIWDPQREVTLSDDMMHDLAGNTPYAGRKLRAGRRPCYRAACHRVGRQAVGRGGFRTFPGACGRGGAKTRRAAGAGHGSRAEFRREAAVSCPPRPVRVEQ
jgi:hypothetical protein